MRKGSETEIGIVLSQKDTVFGPGSKHPVRFIHALGNQIVNENADISLVPTKDKRLTFSKIQACINAGDNALRSGFLIAGSTVNLSRKKQIINYFRA